MEGSNKERWLQLAQLAANEQDPVKLIELVEEINRVLQEKERRMKIVLQERKQRLKSLLGRDDHIG